MSIEKITKAVLEHDATPFTTMFNDVINGIKDMAALGLYSYLASKPAGWKINKKQLMKHFDCGRDRLDSAIKKLKELGLIEVKSFRNEKGQISDWKWLLKRHIPKVIDDNTTSLKNSTVETKNQITENPDCGKHPPLINKRKISSKKRSFNTLVRNDEKPVVRTSARKNVSSTSSAALTPSTTFPELFELLYAAHPKQQQKQRAYKEFQKLNLDKPDVLHLIDDIQRRYKGVEKRYVPLLANYLCNHTWEDEIIKNTPSFKGIGVYDNHSTDWAKGII